MATAEEILNTMPADADEYEEVCTIDLNARTVYIPEKLKVVGVESDEDVTSRKFKMLWQYGENDLSAFTVRINYENAKGEGGKSPVISVAKSGDEMTFSWLLSRKALQHKGYIRFVVCMTQWDGSEITKEWNTTVAEFKVLEGLEIDGDVDEDEDNGGSGGGIGSITATDDGKGNVTLTITGSFTVLDDDKGNVIIG